MSSASDKFSITNQTLKWIPRVDFERIKNDVLGKNYELSLVFCGDKLSKRLNNRFRGKDKAANVLSFPLSGNSGEIFINLIKIGELSVLELFVHGLLHLKGMRHGAKMLGVEKQLIKKWLVKSQSA